MVVPPNGWCANKEYPRVDPVPYEMPKVPMEDVDGEAGSSADSESEAEPAKDVDSSDIDATENNSENSAEVIPEVAPIPACLECMTESHHIFTTSYEEPKFEHKVIFGFVKHYCDDPAQFPWCSVQAILRSPRSHTLRLLCVKAMLRLLDEKRRVSLLSTAKIAPKWNQGSATDVVKGFKALVTTAAAAATTANATAANEGKGGGGGGAVALDGGDANTSVHSDMSVNIARNVGLELIRNSGRSVISGDHDHAIKLLKAVIKCKEACYTLVIIGGIATAGVMAERKVYPFDADASEVLFKYAKQHGVAKRLIAETQGVDAHSW